MSCVQRFRSKCPVGQSFLILTADQGIEGQFETRLFPPLDTGYLSLDYGTHSVSLRVVPEPSTLLLGLTAALLGLVGLVRRRRVSV